MQKQLLFQRPLNPMNKENIFNCFNNFQPIIKTANTEQQR